MPIRVSYLLSAIHTPFAGTEGHLLRLIRALDRNEIDPELILMQHTPWSDEFQDDRVPLTVLGFKSFQRPQDWLTVSKLAKHWRRRRTDVIEMHSTDAQFVGGLAARLSGVPVAVSCRRNLGYQYGTRERVLQKIANRFATTFLANARVVAAAMSELEGISPDRFDVIHNGIDLTAFDQAAQYVDEQVEKFERSIAGSRVVSIAANLRPVKNLELFLEAAARIVSDQNDVVFAVMGQGNLEQTLRSQAERLGISQRVLWLGSVPSVAPYLVRSDIACLTSTSEGFSNAIVEYMSAGLPVVVTDVGGASEAVEDGKTGFVVPSGDADMLANRVLQILQLDDVQRSDMGQRARARVESSFSMERQLKAYFQLYTRELNRLSNRDAVSPSS